MNFSINPCIISKTDEDISFLISAIIIKTSKGHNIVPCGTPLSTGESALGAFKMRSICEKIIKPHSKIHSNSKCF